MSSLKLASLLVLLSLAWGCGDEPTNVLNSSLGGRSGAGGAGTGGAEASSGGSAGSAGKKAGNGGIGSGDAGTAGDSGNQCPFVFLPEVRYPTDSGTRATALGDFNGDGNLDIVAVNPDNNNASVLLNKGNGTFEPALNTLGLDSPDHLAVGDLNGDEKLDVVVMGYSINSLLGNGDGTFKVTNNSNVQTQILWINDLTLADLDADGKLDLILVASFTGVCVMLGKGDGTFQNEVCYTLENKPNTLAVGDLNGDGKQDLVIGATNLFVLLGKGNGDFDPPLKTKAGYAMAIALGDITEDGNLDVAVVDQSHYGVDILAGDGKGTLNPAHSLDMENAIPSALVLGDLNGDQSLDIAGPAFGGIGVLLSKQKGNFGPPISLPVTADFGSFALGDLNGDGKLDVAVPDRSSNTVVVRLQGICE